MDFRDLQISAPNQNPNSKFSPELREMEKSPQNKFQVKQSPGTWFFESFEIPLQTLETPPPPKNVERFFQIQLFSLLILCSVRHGISSPPKIRPQLFFVSEFEQFYVSKYKNLLIFQGKNGLSKNFKFRCWQYSYLVQFCTLIRLLQELGLYDPAIAQVDEITPKNVESFFQFQLFSLLIPGTTRHGISSRTKIRPQLFFVSEFEPFFDFEKNNLKKIMK